MSNKPLPLRPHHGMCLAYFAGHGYSTDFTSHMERILSVLTPSTPVRLLVKTDAVCAGCPNNQAGLCSKPELVAAYDHAVLERCGLKENAELSFGEFTALVEQNILSSGLRREICGSCQWSGICDAQPSRWAKKSESV